MQTRSVGSLLSPDTCRDRLSNSRRGFLACTEGGLPNVVPVELRARDGQLLVSANTLRLREQLVGQVVAVSIGKHAFRYCRGWTVIARGRLGLLRDDGAIPLEIAQLDGVTYIRPAQRRTP
jgi:nitroimidazol reductase NimA-like FMN-containing flavoprotein (pyridoxamine 5'-phosphate oxidase superfamily)